MIRRDTTGLIVRPESPAPVRAATRWIERLPLARGRPVLGTATMFATVAIAWLLRMVFNPVLPPGFPYVTFFPAVIITSFLFGIRLGTVAAILCGLLSWYFFIPPAGFLLDRGALFALAFYAFVVVTDLALVHWMQLANRQLASEREVNRALAETRELLFRELQHRVSNNLQVAAALLNMQKRQLTDPAARDALDEAARRLGLIGGISRQLYDPNGAANPLVPFLADLARSVLDASGRNDLLLVVRGDQALRLQPDAAIPTALIVAEAVANAIEHGFAGGRDGTITVTVADDAATGLRVLVQDDGRGLPEGFQTDASTSLGLRIATTLAKGQGGSFALQNMSGTTATLLLPQSASFA